LFHKTAVILFPILMLMPVGCAYHLGAPNASASSSGVMIVSPPLVDNQTGVPGLEERFLDSLLLLSREYPELRIVAGDKGIPVTVVVRKAATDIIVKDKLDRVVESRRHLIADVTVGDGPAVVIDTGRLSAGEGLALNRRIGADSIAQQQAVDALARAVLDLISSGGNR